MSYGKYGRKVSWNVKWYGKYGRKASRIVKRFGKYRRKLWKDMKNMENMEEKSSNSLYISVAIDFKIAISWYVLYSISLSTQVYVHIQSYNLFLHIKSYVPYYRVKPPHKEWKYGRKASRIVKRFGKYRRKLWKDMKNMENTEEKYLVIFALQSFNMLI
jgi:rRNA maturation protein Nop10